MTNSKCIGISPLGVCLGLTVVLLGVLPGRGYASSSGLNNIPTADTAPNLTLVLQEYSLSGAQRRPDHVAAFKFGIDPWETKAWRNRLEVGIDGSVATGRDGPAVLQAKWATQFNQKSPAISIGVANVASTAEERRRSGAPFSFVVLTEDLKYLRLHGGYGLQAGNNNTAILGIEKPLRIFHRAAIVRADAIQTEHQENWLVSFGGLYVFCKYFALEAWVNQPIHGYPASVVLKANFVIPFKP